MLNGKSIFVSGATGSFGRRFVRTVLERYSPRRLIVFSRDELKQYDMQRTFSHDSLRFFLGDVRDENRLMQAMRDVDFVIHAAALKQVPAAEYNPMECIKTNVMGAQHIITAALANGIGKVIALSTDKAANPINLYGATKLASDKLFVAANNIAGTNRTRFAVVRYGNVIGSRGSVVPLFRQLVSDGARDLPITDRRMTRFWITLQEGVDFVLRCMQRMHGGEVFVPKIPSARMTDLAEAIGAGLPTREIGIRPGEKVHEVMVTADDARLALDFPDHYVIQPSISFNEHPDFSCNAAGERGRPVDGEFEYNSGTNDWFLSVPEIRDLIARAE